MTTDDDEPFNPVRPDDPAQQQRYLREVRALHPQEAAAVDALALEAAVTETLRLCPPLTINDPAEILRLLALILLLTPDQKQSPLLTSVIYRVLMARRTWGARKRLNFIYRFVVGRAPPDPEPDFGVWYVPDPRWDPAVTFEDLSRSVFQPLAPLH